MNSAPNSVGAGNISIDITPTIVPEPTGLTALGLAGLLCLRRRSSLV